MEKFTMPTLEVKSIVIEDVITTSNENGNGTTLPKDEF